MRIPTGGFGGRAALGAALLLSLGASAALGGWVLEFERMVSPSPGLDDLQRPTAVAVDPVNGDLLITDGSALLLQIVDPRGIPLFRTGQMARLALPMDAALLADGDLLLTDSRPGGGREVRRLDFRGEPVPFDVETPLEAWYPTRLGLTRDGGFVVLDEGKGLLSKHEQATGRIVWTHSLRDFSGEDEEVAGWTLGRPTEAPNGRLYLPGGSLHHILVFESTGEPALAFGEFGSAVGRMTFPMGVAFAPDGAVLVLDRMRHTILVFDPEHRFQAEFARVGTRPGDLYHPISIASDGDSTVYVAQGYDARVQRYRLYDPGLSRGEGP